MKPYRTELVAAIGRELDRRAARRRRSRWGAALAVATAGVAAFALTAVAPWDTGPSVLERAQAAIAAPAPGQILYEQIALHATRPLEPGSKLRGSTTPLRIWLDGAAPHRFRMTFTPIFAEQPPGEVGGLVGSTAGLSYAGADNLLSPMIFRLRVTEGVLDPAAFARAELAAGRATNEGTTTVRGIRTVQIALLGRQGEVLGHLYSHAGTYRPVRLVIDALHSSFLRPSLPLTCITPLLDYACLGRPPGNLWIYDFEEYRYLPRTKANRALADIRASHPGAEIV